MTPHIASLGTTRPATALLSLQLNGVELFETAVVVRGDDVLMTVADLAKAGLHPVPVATEAIAGADYVLLRSLAPAVRYTLDERALALRLSVPAEYLAHTVVDLRGSSERFAPDGSSSAFLNYALALNGFRTVSEFSEFGASIHGNLYYTGFRLDPSGALIRGLSNATFDDQKSMRRWVLGDSFVDSGSLGGATFFGGVGIARNFSLNPSFVRYPGIGVSGSVMTASTASLYVNGQLVGVQQLAPGKFDIRDLPVVAGAGNTQVIIRDAFGRTQSFGSPYYFTTTVLARGLSEYAYGLGAVRRDDGSGRPHYGGIVFSGHENVGLSDWTTAGARFESGNGVTGSGLSAALRLPAGQIGIAGGFSNAATASGSAGQFVYGYQGRRFSATASYSARSDRYATLSLQPSDDRATRQWDIGLGAMVGPRASLSVSGGQAQWRDAGALRHLSLAGAMQLTDRVNVVLTGSRTRGAMNADDQLYLALNWRIGAITLASLSGQTGGSGAGAGIAVQRSLQSGDGLGYFFSQGSGGQVRSNDIVQWQTSRGLYQAEYFQDGAGRAPLVLSAAGGVVAARGGLMFTRAVEDGFAVIDLPGLSGVRGYLNNQEIGRTDAKGRLFIPNLLSYYDNRVEIADQDIPMDYDIQSTEQLAVPPYRGGAIVHFPIRRVRAVSGSIVVERERAHVVPSYGLLKLQRGGLKLATDLGGQGEFYFDDLVPGEYQARVEYGDRSCAFILRVPPSAQPVTPLGNVSCGLPQIGRTGR